MSTTLQEQLDALLEAELKLTTGTAVVTVSIAGKSCTFAQPHLSHIQTRIVSLQRRLGLIPTTVYASNRGRASYDGVR
jgi:hypothetical protein